MANDTPDPAHATDARDCGNLLLVDDDPAILRSYGTLLERSGFNVQTAGDGAKALALLASQRFDAVVSDVSMPELDGMSLLRLVRESPDIDVPVLLITGSPMLESAARAVEYGANRYLIKPVPADTLVKAVEKAVRLHRVDMAKRRALELLGPQIEAAVENAGLHDAYARAVESLWMVFQPIVRWSTRAVVGYEALARNGELRLQKPDQLITAAERLGQLGSLGRSIRSAFAADARSAPPGPDLYLNLHPSDLADDDLFSPDAPLSALAKRVVLEITERASLASVGNLRARIASLRGMGFRVAIDDLGAGYAGLTSFTQLEPDVVKLDMGLVRDADREPTKAMLLASLIRLCAELGIEVIAEGVETAGERDMLVSLGCDLLQGFLFARPGKPFPLAVF